MVKRARKPPVKTTADETEGALTPAQLEIMNVVWAAGEVTVAEVVTALRGARPVARNTVQTMLTRLVDRGWLRARADGNVHRFSATQPRARVLSRLARRVVDIMFGGSSSGLMAALLDDGHKLSAEEASRIRALIERSEGRR
jgi:BlaI family transcriptional regulator, penicillinase repressor